LVQPTKPTTAIAANNKVTCFIFTLQFISQEYEFESYSATHRGRTLHPADPGGQEYCYYQIGISGWEPGKFGYLDVDDALMDFIQGSIMSVTKHRANYSIDFSDRFSGLTTSTSHAVS
jgi:hypothetical protein